MSTSPFKFLDSFKNVPQDKATFFGRDLEISLLYKKTFESDLVLVYGASGTGKTSLVNCGLGKKFADTDWLPLFITRKDNINKAFDRAINQRAKSMIPRVQVNAQGTIVEYPIDKKVQRLYLDYYKPIFLIFDQFEELYILGKKTEQDKFYDRIKYLLESPVQCKILIIIREEFLAQLSAFESIVPSLFDNRLRLEKMTDQNLKKVIIGSINYVDGLRTENDEAVAQAIIDNLRGKVEEGAPKKRIELTDLQLYLDRLYQQEIKRKGADLPEKVIDLALVEEVGFLENVMAKFLQEQVSVIEQGLKRQFNISEKNLPLKILYEFVTTEQTKQSIAKQVIIDQYLKKEIQPEVIEYCLQKFQDARLLNIIEE